MATFGVHIDKPHSTLSNMWTKSCSCDSLGSENMESPENLTDYCCLSRIKFIFHNKLILKTVLVSLTEVNVMHILIFNPILEQVSGLYANNQWHCLRHGLRLCLHQQDLRDTMHTITLLLTHFWAKRRVSSSGFHSSVESKCCNMTWFLSSLWHLSSCTHNDARGHPSTHFFFFYPTIFSDFGFWLL